LGNRTSNSSCVEERFLLFICERYIACNTMLRREMKFTIQLFNIYNGFNPMFAIVLPRELLQAKMESPSSPTRKPNGTLPTPGQLRVLAHAKNTYFVHWPEEIWQKYTFLSHEIWYLFSRNISFFLYPLSNFCGKALFTQIRRGIVRLNLIPIPHLALFWNFDNIYILFT
jgi:hypothetical protein